MRYAERRKLESELRLVKRTIFKMERATAEKYEEQRKLEKALNEGGENDADIQSAHQEQA